MNSQDDSFSYEGSDVSRGNLEAQINRVWKKLNVELKASEPKNELFVLDFTFVVHRRRSAEVFSTYKFVHDEYGEFLKEFLAEGQALLKVKNAIRVSVQNIHGKGRRRRKADINHYKETFTTVRPIAFRRWHDFLKSKDYGGCSYILFNRLELADEQEIELGIYCVLKHPLEEVRKEDGSAALTGESEELKQSLETILHKFLILSGQKMALGMYLESSLRNAVKAKISQIMARNMSHNINSHVSYKATNPNVKKRIMELYGYEFK